MMNFIKKTTKLSCCALALLASGQTFAGIYETIGNATNFTDGANWMLQGGTTCAGGIAVGGTIPSSGNNVFVICPGHTLTLDADHTFYEYGIRVFGTLNLSGATLTVPFTVSMPIVLIGEDGGSGSILGGSGLPNTGQLISGTRPHEFLILATAKGTQTQLGNSKITILAVGTEALALSAANVIDFGIGFFDNSGIITGTAKFADGSMFGNQGIQVNAPKTLPTIDLSAFTGTTGAGKIFEFQGAFSNTITTLKLPTMLGTEIKFIVPENQTLTINGTTGNSMSCTGSATAGTTTPNSTPRTSAPFVFTASTTASSTSTFVCTTVPIPAVSAPIDFSFSNKQPETYSTDIDIK